MNIKEIISEYKEGDSIQRLSISSNIATLFASVIALITSQIFTLKFVFDEYTFIILAFYMGAMGLTLLLIFIYIKVASSLTKLYKSYLFKGAICLLMGAVILLFISSIWVFVLTIQ